MNCFKYILSGFLIVTFESTMRGAEVSTLFTSPKGKSSYHLLNPTPKDQMREMSTDRPDKTESAYTVDAGHFQLESDLFAWTHDHHNPEREDVEVNTYNVTTLNLKAGLLNNVDFQLVLEPYSWQRTISRIDSDGDGIPEVSEEKIDGFGDITTRLKINVWGNDGGKTALAVMPFLKFPTNQNSLGNNAIEGGLIIPLAVELPCEWGMGIMTEFDFNKDDVGFINSITFSHDIIGNLGGYVELFTNVSSDDDTDLDASFDMGLTYALSDDVQLDAGLNIGLTRTADDLNPFIGLSVRY
jgi:hypothetical protein